jgi:uncharacterized protein
VAQPEAQLNCLSIDSLKAVHDRQVYSGVMPVAGFARLADSLQDSGGNLEYQVRGDVDRQERPMLRLRVSGTVQLQCQRCLDVLEHQVKINTAVRLVAPHALSAEHDDNPDTPDCVATSSEFDLAALIEDEVLLALPAYPRHDEAQCKANKEASAAGAKILPFSVLQTLKQK